MNQDQSRTKWTNSMATQLYKDSLAFSLLRMHGFSVSPCTMVHNYDASYKQYCVFLTLLSFFFIFFYSFSYFPGMFCWFLREEVQDQIERNHEYFSSVILNVYRATDLMFPGDHVLEEARSFSRKLLEKTISKANKDQNIVPFPSFQSVVISYYPIDKTKDLPSNFKFN